MTSNRLEKVAVVGAGGNVGRFITEALLETGHHKVTAITREESQTKLPEGVSVQKVNYSDPSTLVAALRGHDALIITLSGHSPIREFEEKIVRAAAEAEVPWILPNEWSPDTAHEELVRDVALFQSKVATRELIEKLGKSSYVSIVTGFWYEYTLANAGGYGFDLVNRNVTFYDEGLTKVSTTTWPQVGRAVARLLSLPVKADDEPSLENYRNKMVYISSFTMNQEDMLESVLRVTNTQRSDWSIKREAAKERYESGLAEVKGGNRSGWGKIMFTRVFFPDGCGDFEHGKGTLNQLLGLPKENIDDATKVAIERAQSGRAF